MKMASMFLTMILMALFANANSPNLLKCYSAYLTAQEDGNSNFFTVQGLQIPENGEDFTVDEWWAYFITDDLAKDCATEEVFHFMKKVFAGNEGAIQFMVSQFVFDPIAEQRQAEHEEVEENSVAEVAEEPTGRRSLLLCLFCARCCIPAAQRAYDAVTNSFEPQQQAPEAPELCIIPPQQQNIEVADVFLQPPTVVVSPGTFEVADAFQEPGQPPLPEGELDVADVFQQYPHNHHVVYDINGPFRTVFDDFVSDDFVSHPASSSTRSSSRNRRTVRVCGVDRNGRDLREARQIQVQWASPHPIHHENRRLAELHRLTFMSGWNSFSSSVSSGWDSFSSSVGGLFGRRSLVEGTTSNPAYDFLLSKQGKSYNFPVQEMLSNCDEFGEDPICLLAQWGPIEFELWIEEMCNLEHVHCESLEGRRALLDDFVNGKLESNSVNEQLQSDSNVYPRRKM